MKTVSPAVLKVAEKVPPEIVAGSVTPSKVMLTASPFGDGEMLPESATEEVPDPYAMTGLDRLLNTGVPLSTVRV